MLTVCGAGALGPSGTPGLSWKGQTLSKGKRKERVGRPPSRWEGGSGTCQTGSWGGGTLSTEERRPSSVLSSKASNRLTDPVLFSCGNQGRHKA